MTHMEQCDLLADCNEHKRIHVVLVGGMYIWQIVPKMGVQKQNCEKYNMFFFYT